MVRRKDGNSLLESLQNSYSEVVACVEVTPNVTDSIEIPVKLTKTAVYGIGVFYDKDMDNTFKSGVDMEIQDSNSDNDKLVLDKEELIQPCSIVGVY